MFAVCIRGPSGATPDLWDPGASVSTDHVGGLVWCGHVSSLPSDRGRESWAQACLLMQPRGLWRSD